MCMFVEGTNIMTSALVCMYFTVLGAGNEGFAAILTN